MQSFVDHLIYFHSFFFCSIQVIKFETFIKFYGCKNECRFFFYLTFHIIFLRSPHNLYKFFFLVCSLSFAFDLLFCCLFVLFLYAFCSLRKFVFICSLPLYFQLKNERSLQVNLKFLLLLYLSLVLRISS